MKKRYEIDYGYNSDGSRYYVLYKIIYSRRVWKYAPKGSPFGFTFKKEPNYKKIGYFKTRAEAFRKAKALGLTGKLRKRRKVKRNPISGGYSLKNLFLLALGVGGIYFARKLINEQKSASLNPMKMEPMVRETMYVDYDLPLPSGNNLIQANTDTMLAGSHLG